MGSDLLSSRSTLENQFYRIAFDPATGAITSIRDKQLDVELVDQGAPQKFNEYLYERYESPQARTSKWYRVQSAQLAATSGPVASLMTIKASAVGADQITQTVMLYHDLKRIDFVLDLVKSPSGRTCRISERQRAEQGVGLCGAAVWDSGVPVSSRVARRGGRADSGPV